MTKVMIAMLATALLATSASSASAKDRQDMAVLKKPAAMASRPGQTLASRLRSLPEVGVDR